MGIRTSLLTAANLVSRYHPAAAERFMEVLAGLDNGVALVQLMELQVVGRELVLATPVLGGGPAEVLLVWLSRLHYTAMASLNTPREWHGYLHTYAADNYAFLARIYSDLAMPGRAYEYQVRSLSPAFDSENPERPVKVELPAFVPMNIWQEAIDANAADSRHILIGIAAHHFYVCRVLAYDYPGCHWLYERSLPYLVTGKSADVHDLFFLSEYAALLAVDPVSDRPLHLLPILKSQIQIEQDRRPELARVLAGTLATRYGAMLGESPREWAHLALSLNAPSPSPELELQLRVIRTVDAGQFEPDAVEELVANYLSQARHGRLGNLLGRQKLGETIGMCVHAAILAGDYSSAIRMARLWRTYDLGSRSAMPEEELCVLFVCSEVHRATALLSYKGKVRLLEQKKGEYTFRDILDLKNEHERVFVTEGGVSQPTAPPNGVKSQEYWSVPYEEVLTSYYPIVELANAIHELQCTDEVRVLEMPGGNQPVVPLLAQLVAGGASHLVTDQALPPTDIRKVLIWCDPDEKHPAVMTHHEAAALRHLLQARGIQCDAFIGPDACSRDSFAEKYRDPEYDLIWIMCHGEFDSDAPPDSVLYCAPTPFTLGELMTLAPSRPRRRLLVLNACESGCAAIRYDSLPFLGFGPALTTPGQSVIGHLWSVHNYASGLMGVLLLLGLLDGLPWALSLKQAQEYLQRGRNHVRELLARHLPPDTALLSEHTFPHLQLDRLLYWGSAVLYQ